MRLILAAEGWHLDYTALCTTAWRKFFPEFKITLCIVRDNRKPYSDYDGYKQYVDDLMIVDNIDDICMANLAKMARLYAAAQYGGEIVTLNDIDLVPTQRIFYASKYAQYVDGKIMLMGSEVYERMDRGRVPMSALTAPSYMLNELLRLRPIEPFHEFVDAWRRTGERTPENRADVLNAPYFSDECLIREALRASGAEFLENNIMLIERGYDWQKETADRAIWDRLDIDKLFRGEYLEAHLLKAYKPNLVVCDKLFEEWGYIPGLKPILDYIGVNETYMERALDEAIKIYGLENAMRCYNYGQEVAA